MAVILSFFPLLSINVHARWLSIQESPSVVERLHMEFDVKKDGTWTQTVEYITRVQSEDAKVHSSIFTIDYNSVTDKVEILDAYTKNGSQKFTVAKSAIEDRDKGDSRDYDAMKVMSVVYPQVQVGSALHVRYKIVTAKPLLVDRWSTQMAFMPSVHVKDMRVTVKSEKPIFYELKDTRKLLELKQTNPRHLVVRNIKPLPGWIHAEKDAYFHPGSFSEVWVSTDKNWNQFVSVLESDYSKILNVGMPAKLQPWVDQAAKLKTPEEKINFVLEKMSAAFRYFGDWRRHDGGLVPRPLTEIESSRYGDCKDLTALLVSILRNLQMEADVALIRRGDNPWGAEPDYVLPATNRFNHAVALVKVDGKNYWLDPTNPVTSLVPYPDISGRPAWVMGREKGGRLR